MKEVTKEEFKKLYLKFGGGDATGWGLDYWNKFFADRTDMKYLVDEPETPQHTRMTIVTDPHAKEYRQFFLTEEEDERFLEWPGES